MECLVDANKQLRGPHECSRCGAEANSFCLECYRKLCKKCRRKHSKVTTKKASKAAAKRELTLSDVAGAAAGRFGVRFNSLVASFLDATQTFILIHTHSLSVSCMHARAHTHAHAHCERTRSCAHSHTHTHTHAYIHRYIRFGLKEKKKVVNNLLFRHVLGLEQ